MTDVAANWMAIIFGVAVFAVIVVTGWRSVQKRRIVRLQSADGHETVIVANEDDEISSVVTTTTGSSQPPPTPASPSVAVNADVTIPEPAPVFGRSAAKPETAA